MQSPFQEFYDQKRSVLRQKQEEEQHQGRVQCAIHMACSLLQLISTATQVTLPYKLVLKNLGFEIHDSSGVNYPLYLLIEPPLLAGEQEIRKSQLDASLAIKYKLKTVHVIRFEQAVVLLDQNIQFLLFNFRHQLF